MDHVAEFYDYYSSKNGLINMEKKLQSEVIQKKLQSLLYEYENLEVVDETPSDITYKIYANDHLAGTMLVQIIDLNGSPAFEILKINLNDKFKGIQVIKDAINSLWNTNNKIDKMVVSPNNNIVNMNFSGVFWEKIYFERLNDDYLIRLRGH